VLFLLKCVFICLRLTALQRRNEAYDLSGALRTKGSENCSLSQNHADCQSS